MATFLSLHIKSDNRMHVAKILQELSNVNQMTYGDLSDKYGKNLLFDENADPNYMLISDVQNNWINVHINSFKKLHKWVEVISKELDTSVIQIMGQTVSDVYYFLMYTKGVLVREIEVYHGDFENMVDVGERFNFQKTSFIPLNDEDWTDLFDRETLEKYCKELGFDLFHENNQEPFFILEKTKIGKIFKKNLFVNEGIKPWWKFW